MQKHTGHQLVCSGDWEQENWSFGDYPKFDYELPKPSKLNEMISICKILARDFKYVRVDIYQIENTVYFGEMTFTPASGFYQYDDRGDWTEASNMLLGAMISL